MAKKKNSKGGGGGIILLLILIFGIALIATPLVLIGGTIYSFVSYLRNKKFKKGNYSTFWLNSNEKSEFETVATKLLSAIENIEKAEKTGNNEGLAKNKDGSFSLRGNRGKEIQGIINTNTTIRNKYYPAYDYLRYLPQSKWKKYVNSVTNFYSFLIASLTWIISASVVISEKFEDFQQGLNTILNFPANLIKEMFFTSAGYVSETQITSEQWYILIVSAGISIVAFFIFKLVNRIIVSKTTKMPPVVSLKNLNDY